MMRSFTDTYQKWCKKEGYYFRTADAEKIYNCAKNAIATLPKNQSTKILISQAVGSLNAVYDALQSLRKEITHLASLLPEYSVVMAMQGAGEITGPMLMAEIGDVRRFTSKNALVAFAGIDAPPYQSGIFDSKSRHVSKRGSPPSPKNPLSNRYGSSSKIRSS
mgnify:CR=1 FL=1